MEAVLRPLAVYFFLLVVVRLSGKRTLAQITTFDFVLLLIIGEATQQGLIGDDFSVTKALLLITTLIAVDVGMSLLQGKLPFLDKVIDGTPVVILEDGRVLEKRINKSRIDESDIMETARAVHGLERLEQIKYAVLERDGGISIIPKAGAAWRSAQPSTTL